MTRINCGVSPEKLTNVHLLAELRELPRIPNMIKNGRYSLENKPVEFTLGTGHVKFFYDKLEYLRKRYENLYGEGIKRGLNIKYLEGLFSDLPEKLMNDYCETPKDTSLIVERIKERILANTLKYKDLDKVKNLSIRKFSKILARVDHKLHYQIYLSASMSGMVKFKDKNTIRHWLSDLSTDRLKDSMIGFDEFKNKMSPGNNSSG